jgi:flagellar FliL protein
MKKIQVAAVLCIFLSGCGEKIKPENLVGHWLCSDDSRKGENATNMSFSSAGRFDWIIPTKISSIVTYASADYVLDGSSIKMPEIWLDATGIPYDTNPGPQKSSRSVMAEIQELTDTTLKMVWTSTSTQKNIGREASKIDCKRKQHEANISTASNESQVVASPQRNASNIPATVDLEPFTVNLQPENGEQYLQTKITLNLNGEQNADAVNSRIPEVRNSILLTLSGKKASEISTTHGKKTLAKELVETINSLSNSNSLGVNDIFFTSFMIQ